MAIARLAPRSKGMIFRIAGAGAFFRPRRFRDLIDIAVEKETCRTMTVELYTSLSTLRSRLPGIVALTVIAALIQGCSAEDSSGGGADNDGSSYLTVSHDEMYFGTRDVGVETQQTLILTNQSADVYPVNEISLTGASASEFTLEDYDGAVITLNPGDQYELAVSFMPETEGWKNSNLQIDHDIIAKASNAVNKQEQQYYKAKSLEQARQYDESLQAYRDYIDSDPVVQNNKRRASVKVPVLSEADRQSDTADVRLYTTALNYRDRNNSDAALQTLDRILDDESSGYLADDALYLKGYIYLVDQKNFEEAYNTMLALRFQYPDSSYYDTALYVEAIAQKELGDTELAESLFEELRARHTGLSIEVFNLEWPKDNYLSRLWFDRSEKGLAELNSAG